MGCRATNDDDNNNYFLATREKGIVVKTKEQGQIW
jgi:hypothetical protein